MALHLPIEDMHLERGAVMAPREGWQTPEEYGDWQAEYGAIRNAAAVIDRSDRSRFMLTGTDAIDVLEAVVTGHPREIEEGRARRCAVLEEEGAIVDLLLVARTGGIAYLVSGEPGRREETRRRLEAAIAEDFDVQIDDRTERTCLIGLVGPRAAEVASGVLAESLPSRVQTLQAALFEFRRFRTLAVRTSDVGEDGFELVVSPDVARHLIEVVTAQGAILAGRRAHEAARIEAGVPAGADLAAGLTPSEAGLTAALDLDEAADVQRRLSCLLLAGGEAPRPGAAIAGGGQITSSAWSPVLGAPVAMAILPLEKTAPGTVVSVGDAGATVVSRPILRRRQNQ